MKVIISNAGGFMDGISRVNEIEAHGAASLICLLLVMSTKFRYTGDGACARSSYPQLRGATKSAGPRMSDWTDERVIHLRRLWDEGHSAS